MRRRTRARSGPTGAHRSHIRLFRRGEQKRQPTSANAQSSKWPEEKREKLSIKDDQKESLLSKEGSLSTSLTIEEPTLPIHVSLGDVSRNVKGAIKERPGTPYFYSISTLCHSAGTGVAPGSSASRFKSSPLTCSNYPLRLKRSFVVSPVLFRTDTVPAKTPSGCLSSMT